MNNKIKLLFVISILLISCKKNETTKIEMNKIIETSLSWDGTALPKYPDGEPRITILRATFPPNTTLKMHKHPVINAGVLLKGELTVISEHNDTLYLKTGDPIVELVNTWHYGINESDTTAEIIVFYAGTDDAPISIIKETK